MTYISLRRCVVALLLCLVGTALFALPLSAQVRRHSAPSSSDDTQGHVTIIVLDMSGSMGGNDPQGLRCSAANAYIDLSGVRDYIGIVGLDNNNGNRVGNNQFQEAQIWTDPINTATVADRQNLRSIIATKSRSCSPDNTTPTYDALDKALNMLQTVTTGKQLTGSVILLTDGAPDPDTTQQIDKVQSDLLPSFKQHAWPIDTIALGTDGPAVQGSSTTFHDFLGNVASATGGKFYDDGKGQVAGVSPLNIAPFFVDIFAHRVGRTATQDIPPTQLDGGTTKRNFSVTDFTNNLDVVVVKDQPSTTVSLVTPKGQTITANNGGILTSQDPHYVIFSIDQPVAGQWEVDVTGTGQFLLNSLKSSNIGVSITKVELKDANLPPGDVWPLGQTLKVTANLTSNGRVITDNSFTVNGNISYNGSAGQYSQDFALDDSAVPGSYAGFVAVPTSAPAGSYNINLGASTVSETNVVSSGAKSIRLELFPVPLFISTQTNMPTDATISTTALQWPLPFQFLYNLPVLNALSGWPLQGHPALPYTNLSGVVQWQGQLYQNAQITAQAFLENSKTAIPARVNQDGPGHFRVLFVPPTSGNYQIIILTSGSYKDSHGDFGPTIRMVNVTVAPATVGQLLLATIVSAFYLLLMLFIIFFVKFLLTPGPFGEWEQLQAGEVVGGFRFDRSHRNLKQSFFSRNIVSSRQARMPRGLKFRFQSGGIEACPDDPGSSDWQTPDGSRLRPQFQRVRELVFKPSGSDNTDEDVSRYTIIEQRSKKSSYDDFGDAHSRSSSQKQRKPAYSYDESYDDSFPSKRQGSKRARQKKNIRRYDDYA